MTVSMFVANTNSITTAHPWCDDQSTSISTCEVWGARAGVQVSGKELHTHIHLDYVRVEFYLVSKIIIIIIIIAMDKCRHKYCEK